MIVEPAPAKLNLALHVRRRRPDGYHDIETLFAFCHDGDVVTVAPADADSFTVTGPFATALGHPHPSGASRLAPSPAGRGKGPAGVVGGMGEDDGDNLVIRARDAFGHAFDLRQHLTITLDKRLPIASGIGGGSADAAATLRLLARYHGIAVDNNVLRQCAASLGADVPACLLGRSAFGTGRGEDLVTIRLPPSPVLLINPLVQVSTAQVFRSWDGKDRGPLVRHPGLAPGPAVPQESRSDMRRSGRRDEPGMTDWIEIAKNGRNDLETPARLIAPVIGDVLDSLQAQPGATLVRMSGSGATCFALFANAAARSAAARAIRAAEPGWWLLESTLA